MRHEVYNTNDAVVVVCSNARTHMSTSMNLTIFLELNIFNNKKYIYTKENMIFFQHKLPIYSDGRLQTIKKGLCSVSLSSVLWHRKRVNISSSVTFIAFFFDISERKLVFRSFSQTYRILANPWRISRMDMPFFLMNLNLFCMKKKVGLQLTGVKMVKVKFIVVQSIQ